MIADRQMRRSLIDSVQFRRVSLATLLFSARRGEYKNNSIACSSFSCKHEHLSCVRGCLLQHICKCTERSMIRDSRLASSREKTRIIGLIAFASRQW